MNKDEKIKKLNENIKRIERAITQLSYIKYDVMGITDDDYMYIMMYNDRALESLRVEKSLLEKRLKTLQESNENTINI